MTQAFRRCGPWSSLFGSGRPQHLPAVRVLAGPGLDQRDQRRERCDSTEGHSAADSQQQRRLLHFDLRVGEAAVHLYADPHPHGLRELRQFDNDQSYVDPRSLEALQASALEKLKTMEFGLKKKADGKDLPLTLSGSEEVPEGFRDAIAEYYRSVARKRQ